MSYWNDKNGYDDWLKEGGGSGPVKPPKPKPPKPKPPEKPPEKPEQPEKPEKTPEEIAKEKAAEKAARNEKISGALGAAAKIANSLKDPGLGVTFGSDPVRSGANQSRSGTAEGGPDYWRSHRNESGSANDNDED